MDEMDGFYEEDFNGSSNVDKVASSTRRGFASPALKANLLINYEDKLLEQLESLLNSLPIPEVIPRSLLVRGVSASYFDMDLATQRKYGGNAVKVYQLMRLMKWLVFC